MKILHIMSAALLISLGYALPAVSAPIEAPAKMEMRRAPRPEMHHHRGMNMAMMNDLDLSDAQKAQLKSMIERKNNELKSTREQIRALQEQEKRVNDRYEAEMKKVLTAEQLKKYESMLIQKREKMKEGRPHHKK